ncbi:hypothetical protein GALMADRAFT_76420, partial [Galerina marginata CBS 339.88]
MAVLSSHQCIGNCAGFCTIFSPPSAILTPAERQTTWYNKLDKVEKANHINNKVAQNNLKKQKDISESEERNKAFPPQPPSKSLLHKIISGFIQDTSPSQFVEAGCAVCGKLTPFRNLIPLNEIKDRLKVLINPGITRKERKTPEDPISDITGPIIDSNCTHACKTCCASLKKKKIPS